MEFGKNRARKDGLQELCKLCRNAYKAEWRGQNPEKRKSYDKRHYRKYRDKKLEYSKLYRETRDPEAFALWLKEYRKKNRHKIRYYKWKRKALERKALGIVSPDIEKKLFQEQEGSCYYCQEKLDKYHLDHMHPLIRGGMHDDSNLCLACPRCNLRKYTKTSYEFMEELNGDNERGVKEGQMIGQKTNSNSKM